MPTLIMKIYKYYILDLFTWSQLIAYIMYKLRCTQIEAEWIATELCYENYEG